MRFVGIVALAATFWLLLATVRLIVHAPAPVAEPAAPAALLDALELERRLAAGSHHPSCEPIGCMSEEVRKKLASSGGPGPSALIAGMDAVRPRVRACYDRYHVPGTAMVYVTIAKSGQVAKAEITGGRFAGTATGACVEAAVKTARFPPSDGFVTPYPFQLR